MSNPRCTYCGKTMALQLFNGFFSFRFARINIFKNFSGKVLHLVARYGKIGSSKPAAEVTMARKEQAMKKLFYWVDGGMTAKDYDGYFRMVEFDELGYGVEPMTEQELEDEMQSFAHEFGMSEPEVRAYFADRVTDGAYRDLRWERYLQGEC